MYELKENVDIKNLIYEVRGKQVMFDSDLAVLYGCKNGTKEINQAVKNNPLKFPERYCFRISEIEKKRLKSKILTSNYTKGGSRKGNTVFTEQGIFRKINRKGQINERVKRKGRHKKFNI